MSFRVFAASALVGHVFYVAAGDMGVAQTVNVFDGAYLGAGASIVNMFNGVSVYNSNTQGIIPLTLGTLQFQADSGFSSVGVRVNLGYGKTFNSAGYIGPSLLIAMLPFMEGMWLAVMLIAHPTSMAGRLTM